MYIIIGGTGFLGTYIAKAVTAKTEDRVLIVARTEPAPNRGGGKMIS